MPSEEPSASSPAAAAAVVTGSSSSSPSSDPLRSRRRPISSATSTSTTVGGTTAAESPTAAMAFSLSVWAANNRWIVLAITSGACAAFNGVFAKLTTNDLTTHIAKGVSGGLGLSNIEGFVEIVVRAMFFGLNLVFNGVMWTLFTQALASGHSTTQVSIMNTSANFMITALLGLAIFSESLPPLWWAGAVLLVAGNVIIGRKDEGSNDAAKAADGSRDGVGVDGDGGVATGVVGGGDETELGTTTAAAAATGGRQDGNGGYKDSDEETDDEDEDEDEDEDVALIGDVGESRVR